MPSTLLSWESEDRLGINPAAQEGRAWLDTSNDPHWGGAGLEEATKHHGFLDCWAELCQGRARLSSLREHLETDILGQRKGPCTMWLGCGVLGKGSSVAPVMEDQSLYCLRSRGSA